MVCAAFFCMVALTGVAAGAGPGAPPEIPWFTLLETPGTTTGNVVQVRPEPILIDQRILLQLRVSRDEVRTSFRGYPYRSYNAQVAINCTQQKAWYLRISYFDAPLWTGTATAREEFMEGQAPVLFKDIPGESHKRMISAACRTAT